MSEPDFQSQLKDLLVEIRDNQKQALRKQEEHLELVRQQLDRSKAQVDESISLQRQAVARARSIGRIALPAILICIAALIYIVARAF